MNKRVFNECEALTYVDTKFSSEKKILLFLISLVPGKEIQPPTCWASTNFLLHMLSLVTSFPLLSLVDAVQCQNNFLKVSHMEYLKKLQEEFDIINNAKVWNNWQVDEGVPKGSSHELL